jgi:hypothetical protein
MAIFGPRAAHIIVLQSCSEGKEFTMSDDGKSITAAPITTGGEQVSVHIDPIEQHKDVLDYQVDACPTCQSELESGFGLVGGGFGGYGFCPKCERVIWKCQVED